MSTKVGDLSVKNGTYTKDGETKSRFVNVGVLMQDDDGGQFILLNRTFNPAGVIGNEDSESVLISIYKD